MQTTFENIERDALGLPEIDRALLAKRLLISLEPSAEAGVEEAWDSVIAARVREVHEGQAVGRPVEDVLREARAKYS
jgi:hypothetical protein